MITKKIILIISLIIVTASAMPVKAQALLTKEEQDYINKGNRIEAVCKRQVLFHKFRQLIFHKKRQLKFHTYRNHFRFSKFHLFVDLWKTQHSYL